METLKRPDVGELLYGGAKGGGKTTFGCRWIYLNCLDLIKEYDLKPSKQPVHVGYIVRKLARDLRQSVLETWNAHIPHEHYTIKEHKNEIVICDTVKFFYGGMDRSDTIKRFNSAEAMFVWVEQAEETNINDIGHIRGCLRMSINGKMPKRGHKLLLTANPASCWLKGDFIDQKFPGREFIKALWSDNPWLPPDYDKKLMLAWRHRQDMLKAMLEGDWNLISGIDCVIKREWIDDAMGKRMPGQLIRPIVAVDTAREGVDRTVIFYMENTNIIDVRILGKSRALKTQSAILEMCEDHKFEGKRPTVCIECDPNGAAIGDNLVGSPYNLSVIEFEPAKKSDDPRCYNQRVQAWQNVALQMADGEFELNMSPKVREILGDTLETELSWPEWKTPVGSRIDGREKSKISRKDEIKEKHGRSPDVADAFIIGCYGLQYIDPINKPTGYGGDRKYGNHYSETSSMAA